MTYPDERSCSKALFERATRSLPGGNTRSIVYMDPYPIYAVRGQGCRVWDKDNVARLDCINNFTSLIHGYAHPEIVRAVSEQISLGSAFGMPTESEVELAELLCERVASIEKVIFDNSGTEAVMTAIKAARAFTGRRKIAKVEGAYHGSYDYAEVSLDPTPQTWGEPPASLAYARGLPATVLNDVVSLPFNDCRQAEELIRKHASELAAVLMDPLPNRAGLLPADEDYLRKLCQVTTEIGALLVFDEVISFRLGYNGAQQLWGIEPDLTTLGKIIGGGFPVGAVGGRNDIMAVFDATHGKPAVPVEGTFCGNPVTMRAGLATMRLLDPAAFKRLDRMGEQVRSGISEAFHRLGVAGQVVGAGSLLKVHFTDRPLRDYRTAFPSKEEVEMLGTFNRDLLQRGIMAARSGLMALSTPMTDDDLAEIVKASVSAIQAVAERHLTRDSK
jgi:glutamate-1-semialdehyde 2,1-aminomutase